MNFFKSIAFMTDLEWSDLIRIPEVGRFLEFFLIVFVSFAFLWALSAATSRLLQRSESRHFAVLAKKLVLYVGYVIILVTILLELGIDLTGLLATAGLATVAIGFAAQTSLSNLISGLFLIGEKPFKIGDLVRVGTTTGVIESIDLLSVKIRSLDNLFIRIPNEDMIKNQVTNITRYPIRRMDIEVGVAYKEDVGKVVDLFKKITDKNPLVLDEPVPLILFDRFGDSALVFKVGVWFEKSNFLVLKNAIMKEIKEEFDKAGIEIPFPHLTVYTGSATPPFPVQMQKPPSEKS